MGETFLHCRIARPRRANGIKERAVVERDGLFAFPASSPYARVLLRMAHVRQVGIKHPSRQVALRPSGELIRICRTLFGRVMFGVQGIDQRVNDDAVLQYAPTRARVLRLPKKIF